MRTQLTCLQGIEAASKSGIQPNYCGVLLLVAYGDNRVFSSKSQKSSVGYELPGLDWKKHQSTPRGIISFVLLQCG